MNHISMCAHGAGRVSSSRLNYFAERLREYLELTSARSTLAELRDGRDVCWPTDESEPLVTVRIPTYNRGRLVVERAIAGALNQTYERIEVLVVGDHCDPATAAAIGSVRDNRVRFINLGYRGIYPADPESRWMVAGAHPMNVALALAHGSWIAPCDDDDEFLPEHVELLLGHALSKRYEMVHSRAWMENPDGTWRTIGGTIPRLGQLAHGAVLYSMGLRFLTYNPRSWALREPADWNLWRRMMRLGVRIGHVPNVTYRHYVEGVAVARLKKSRLQQAVERAIGWE